MKAMGIKPVAYTISMSCSCGEELWETNAEPYPLTNMCSCGRLLGNFRCEALWPEETLS